MTSKWLSPNTIKSMVLAVSFFPIMQPHFSEICGVGRSKHSYALSPRLKDFVSSAGMSKRSGRPSFLCPSSPKPINNKIKGVQHISRVFLDIRNFPLIERRKGLSTHLHVTAARTKDNSARLIIRSIGGCVSSLTLAKASKG